ncbi:YgfZ/GcvT domain-containing protein [Amaricoccus tamworthensis]|uniref:CAF17-like 4Fe-4S cluster assembly/insertion protein YgfZ n=1 Tax=Amaricoccus tamworthensis TaxID=57002 RepID=UPI003C7D77EA
MTEALHATDRTVLLVSGEDTRDFLQGLVSNDVRRLETEPAVYAALLSPQGKYLFDFFLVASPEGVLVDVATDRAQALAQRLSMYRLRAKVAVGLAERQVVVGLGDVPGGAFADPRDAGLGWRAVVEDAGVFMEGMDTLDPDVLLARRVELCVPESGAELKPDESYILEQGFERLHGVDFRKGCYVGQEVTARMKHKTELRKGLARVEVEGDVAPGTPIEVDGKPVGTLHSVQGGQGLAYLRFDRAEKGGMTAAGVGLRLRE